MLENVRVDFGPSGFRFGRDQRYPGQIRTLLTRKKSKLVETLLFIATNSIHCRHIEDSLLADVTDRR
jgi:hypothetical protein